MQTLLEVKEGQLLQSGIFPSLAPNQQALWRDAINVVFIDGRVETLRGRTLLHSFASNINAIVQANAEGERRAYVGLASGDLHYFSEGVSYRLGVIGAGGNWSLDTWGDWLVATDNVHPVKVWKNNGPDGAVTLAGPDFVRAKIVRRFANVLLAYNTSLGGQSVSWSSLSNIEDWVSTDVNSAGNFYVRDLDGDIVAAETFGRSAVAFYTENTMGFTEFVGAPFYFTNKVRLTGIGAVGRNAVCDANGKHYGAINRWLETNFDRTRGEEVSAFHDPARRSVLFAFPCKDGIFRELAFAYAPTPCWTKHKLDVRSASSRGVFDQSLVGVGADLSLWDIGYADNGVALPTLLTSAFQNVGKRNMLKLWDMLQVDFELVGLVEIRFGFSEYPVDADIEWGAWAPLARENWIGRESNYLVCEIRASALYGHWSISGMTVFGELTGYVQ
jgi:hypothetical protein